MRPRSGMNYQIDVGQRGRPVRCAIDFADLETLDLPMKIRRGFANRGARDYPGLPLQARKQRATDKSRRPGYE